MRNRRRKEKIRQKYIRVTVFVLMMMWTILGVIGVCTVAQLVWGKTLESKSGNVGKTVEWKSSAGEVKENPNEENQSKITQEQITCRQIYENNPDLLVLVNKEQELDVNYDSDLRRICGGRLEASAWMYQDLTELLRAAGDAGFHYWIASAYRSRQRQQELIDEDVQELMQQGWNYEDALMETYRETMPAGHSEHETGLALDILCSGNTTMDESQANEPANQWLVAHCADYGFILRYPKDKEDVTGIDYEPWHFRYVGREAAKYMEEHRMTLEEFCEAVGSV